MEGYIISFIVGVVCVVLGVSNMRGHISSLHSYHRHRVSEEDKVPFGKKVGLGTIICGAAIMAFSILSAINLYIENQLLVIVGTVLLVAGLVAGLGLSFYAMIKYNKGIF
jgi:hypothetical protein